MRARMAAQMEPEQARAAADYVIENDGDLEQLRERARPSTNALYRDEPNRVLREP